MDNLMELNMYFKLKGNFIGIPKIYAEGKVTKVTMDDGYGLMHLDPASMFRMHFQMWRNI